MIRPVLSVLPEVASPDRKVCVFKEILRESKTDFPEHLSTHQFHRYVFPADSISRKVSLLSHNTAHFPRLQPDSHLRCAVCQD